MAFLDVMACGLGAAILLFLIVKHHTEAAVEPDAGEPTAAETEALTALREEAQALTERIEQDRRERLRRAAHREARAAANAESAEGCGTGTACRNRARDRAGAGEKRGAARARGVHRAPLGRGRRRGRSGRRGGLSAGHESRGSAHRDPARSERLDDRRTPRRHHRAQGPDRRGQAPGAEVAARAPHRALAAAPAPGREQGRRHRVQPRGEDAPPRGLGRRTGPSHAAGAVPTSSTGWSRPERRISKRDSARSTLFRREPPTSTS